MKILKHYNIENFLPGFNLFGGQLIMGVFRIIEVLSTRDMSSIIFPKIFPERLRRSMTDKREFLNDIMSILL